MCPNGHLYSTDYYDECPFCKSKTQIIKAPSQNTESSGKETVPSHLSDGKSHILRPGHTPFTFERDNAAPVASSSPAPTAEVRMEKTPAVTSTQQANVAPQPLTPPAEKATPQPAVSKENVTPHPIQSVKVEEVEEKQVVEAHTVIRKAGVNDTPRQKAEGQGRELVALLVCRNMGTEGAVFKVFEGRNFIGRNAGCDICIADDDQVSGRHASIVYRRVDNKFMFRDETSTNGTFVNGECQDSGVLNDHDVISIGNTSLTFLIIPENK